MSRLFIFVLAFVVWGAAVHAGYMSLRTLVVLLLGMASGLLVHWIWGKV